MTKDEGELLNEEDNAEPEQEDNKKNLSDSEIIEKNIQARVAREQAKAARALAEKNAEIDALKQQLQQKSAPAMQQMRAQNGGTAPTQNAQPALNAEQQAQLQQQGAMRFQEQQKQAGFYKQLADAAEKDPEFKKLMTNNMQGGGNFIHPQIMYDDFSHLPNAAAVIKHLQKNGRDYGEVSALLDRSARIKAINQLSEKLEDNETSPRPPEFEPEPDAPMTGSSAQDFNIREYRREKGSF
jgi:hypothetical protein